MNPEVSRARVLAALAQFDGELRPSSMWQDWERRETPTSWAIQHEGRLYPLRQVWMFATDATGADIGYLRGALPALASLGFATIKLADWRARPALAVWWVNQGGSYDYESVGGFVWAPPADKKGADRGAYARIHELRPGDVIVHYASKAIRAISRVTSGAVAVDATRTRDRKVKGGWKVGAEYVELGDRAVASGRLAALFKGLAIDDGPFQANRGIKNGYLWRFSAEGLARLQAAVGAPWPAWATDPKDAKDAADPVAVNEAQIEPGAVSDVFDLAAATRTLIDDIAARGFIYEPWQVAAFITALRTRPFVILAGVSGTGKSRLPALVAGATGSVHGAVPVRPDWTESDQVLGYVDLQDRFRPGPLLHAARRAQADAARLHLFVVDEMNLARVEHYFAEVLSRMEEPAPTPLISALPSPDDAAWAAVALPPNLAIVGTVNMDETTHGFSRKVLDRAFTLEFSDVDLRSWGTLGAGVAAAWPITAWSARPARAAGDDRDAIVEVLVEVNAILAQAQLQVGYRTRDAIVGFVRNAAEVAASFVTRDGAGVDPLDLALLMKILPRIAGSSVAVRQVLVGLLGFTTTGTPRSHEPKAEELVQAWREAGRRGALATARFPRTAARLCLMWERLVLEGPTSFWL